MSSMHFLAFSFKILFVLPYQFLPYSDRVEFFFLAFIAFVCWISIFTVSLIVPLCSGNFPFPWLFKHLEKKYLLHLRDLLIEYIFEYIEFPIRLISFTLFPNKNFIEIFSYSVLSKIYIAFHLFVLCSLIIVYW